MADSWQPTRSQTGRRPFDPRSTSRRQSSFFPGLFPSSTPDNYIRQVFPPLKLDSPNVQITSIVYTLITLDRAEMEICVEVNNPNRVNCTLLSLDIVVESNGRKLLTKKFQREISIRSNLTESIKLPLTIEYKSVVASYPEIKRGQLVPSTVTALLAFQEEQLKSSIIKAEHQGQLPIPVEPSFRIKNVKINQVSMSHCSVELQLKVENKNQFDITVLKVEYEAALSGNKVVKGSAAPDVVVKSKEFTIVDFPVSIWPKEFGAALWNILRGRGKGLFTMHWMMEADSSYGRIQL